MISPMNALFEWLGRAMGDGDSPSSSRLIAVPCAMALILVPVFVWAVLSLRVGQILDFPGTVTGFVAATLTPLLGFLHIQKREETKQNPEVGPS